MNKAFLTIATTILLSINISYASQPNTEQTLGTNPFYKFGPIVTEDETGLKDELDRFWECIVKMDEQNADLNLQASLSTLIDKWIALDIAQWKLFDTLDSGGSFQSDLYTEEMETASKMKDTAREEFHRAEAVAIQNWLLAKSSLSELAEEAQEAASEANDMAKEDPYKKTLMVVLSSYLISSDPTQKTYFTDKKI